jgi:hypothetical protein
MQRAKLFVKLNYQAERAGMSLKEKVRTIKFKRQSNILINDNTLPTKSQLIKICKERLFIDYREFKADGIKNIKDKIILLMFIYHKLIKKEVSNREKLIEEIKTITQNTEDFEGNENPEVAL